MTMTDKKPEFWHDIARQVEKEFAPPLPEAEFQELTRRCRAHAAWLRQLCEQRLRELGEDPGAKP
jgi:hypothetical protein